MPNHIQNRIKFSGEKSKVDLLLESLKSKDKPEHRIDFNNIVPMPEELFMTKSSLGTMAQFALFGTGEDGFLGIDEIQRRFRSFSDEMIQKAVTLALKHQSNLEKHGHSDWYSWSIEKWGTKWNAYSQEDQRDTDDTIFFQTAWSAPVELIILLSKKHPDVKIEFTYADEDIGANTGHLELKAGSVIEQHIPENGSNEAYEISLDLHPDCDWIKLVDGQYTYVED